MDRAARSLSPPSATADLYSVASNVRAIRCVPVDIEELIAITGALLLPFVLVVLLAILIDVIEQHIAGKSKSKLFRGENYNIKARNA